MPKLRLDADARAGVKAFQDLDKAIDKTEKSLELTTREAKKLETAAGRIVKQNEAPLERYNRKVAETAKLVKQGTLSYEQAQAAVSRYGQQLQRAEQRSQGVWGQQAMAGLQSLVGGYTSVAGAVGLISLALRKVEQENQRVADSFFNGLGSIGELQQVSSNEAEFSKNLGFARSLVRRGIFSEIGQAADFTFATTSAGYTDDEKEYLARIGERKQIRPDNLTGFAASARKAQNLFAGESLQAAGDKLLVASGFTQATISETAQAIPSLTAGAKALGYDPNTTLAQLVGGEETAPNIDIAKTEQAALLTAILNKGLSTGTLIGTVDALRQRELAGENISQLLGNVRAFRGYSALAGGQGRADYEASLAALGSSGGALESRDFLAGDPATRAASLKERETGRLNDAIGDRTPIELLLDAFVARLKSEAGDFNKLGIGLAGFTADVTGTEETFIRSNIVTRGVDEAFAKEMLDALNQIKENTAASGTTRQE